MGSLDYFRHLQRSSALGKMYRRFWLFPRIARYCKGQILDVGCGLGHFLEYRPEVIGIDVNQQCVDFCLAKGLAVHKMDYDVIPFNDSSFGTVVLDNVLEHIAEPEKILFEIRRVLEKEGALIVGVPPGQAGFDYDPDHKIKYSIDSLVRLLKHSGFDPVNHFYTPFRSSFLERVARQYCLYVVVIKRR